MELFDELRNRKSRSIDEESYKKFSVTVPLIRKNDGIYVLFEIRANALKRQPGEICFPGGAREPHENAYQNAMRETCEELEIKPSQIRMIAQMDTLFTVYDNRVDVFLCELLDYHMTHSRMEVGELLLVPLRFFMETAPDVFVNYVKLEQAEDFPYERIPFGKDYPWRSAKKNVYFYKYKQWEIWGMTAYIMQSVVKIMKEEGKTIVQ